MKIFLRIVKYLLIIFMLMVALVIGVNFWIVTSTEDYIHYKVSDVPSRKVALLLGTSKRTSEGQNNKYFEERIAAAAALYHSGVVKHIIVSGDNETVYYNEPRDMFNALEKKGVPKSVITLDYAGFRTLDSVVRSKEVFGQDEVLIITQDFHCYRALFIAQFYGIDAIAFSADNKDELPAGLAVREVLARFNTILDLYIFARNPKFLGDREELPID